MKPTQKTSQRPIRDKEAITRSQWEFRQKTRRLPEARENVNGLSAKKKKQKQQQQQKNQFLAPQLTIFNRLLLHLTHSPVPSTVNEEFLAKNVIFRNISPVKRKVEFLWTRNEYYAWCHVRDESRSLHWGQFAMGMPKAAHAVWV